jgi:hypothetical protein
MSHMTQCRLRPEDTTFYGSYASQVLRRGRPLCTAAAAENYFFFHSILTASWHGDVFLQECVRLVADFGHAVGLLGYGQLKKSLGKSIYFSHYVMSVSIVLASVKF